MKMSPKLWSGVLMAGMLSACGGGDTAPVTVAGVTVAAAPLVVSAASTPSMNGTLTKVLAMVEAGSSNAAMTTFNASDEYCRVGAYAMTDSGDTHKYFIEVSFRKTDKAIGLVKFGNDATLTTLASATGPLSSVSVDTADRRIGFAGTTLTPALTLTGSLEYPANALNPAACGS